MLNKNGEQKAKKKQGDDANTFAHHNACSARDNVYRGEEHQQISCEKDYCARKLLIGARTKLKLLESPLIASL